MKERVTHKCKDDDARRKIMNSLIKVAFNVLS
jgi:hypothetical protein